MTAYLLAFFMCVSYGDGIPDQCYEAVDTQGPIYFQGDQYYETLLDCENKGEGDLVKFEELVALESETRGITMEVTKNEYECLPTEIPTAGTKQES